MPFDPDVRGREAYIRDLIRANVISDEDVLRRAATRNAPRYAPATPGMDEFRPVHMPYAQHPEDMIYELEAARAYQQPYVDASLRYHDDVTSQLLASARADAGAVAGGVADVLDAANFRGNLSNPNLQFTGRDGLAGGVAENARLDALMSAAMASQAAQTGRGVTQDAFDRVFDTRSARATSREALMGQHRAANYERHSEWNRGLVADRNARLQDERDNKEYDRRRAVQEGEDLPPGVFGTDSPEFRSVVAGYASDLKGEPFQSSMTAFFTDHNNWGYLGKAEETAGVPDDVIERVLNKHVYGKLGRRLSDVAGGGFVEGESLDGLLETFSVSLTEQELAKLETAALSDDEAVSKAATDELAAVKIVSEVFDLPGNPLWDWAASFKASSAPFRYRREPAGELTPEQVAFDELLQAARARAAQDRVSGRLSTRTSGGEPSAAAVAAYSADGTLNVYDREAQEAWRLIMLRENGSDVDTSWNAWVDYVGRKRSEASGYV